MTIFILFFFSINNLSCFNEDKERPVCLREGKLEQNEEKIRMWTSANSIVNMYLKFPFS